MGIYKELGLSSVINASGRMTKLGVSCIQDEVKKAMNEAAQQYVVIDDLMIAAGKRIAQYIKCADVCITSSASSGIALAIASLLCDDNLQRVQNFHDTVERIDKKEVILLRGHSIDFGAPIDLMIQTGGGEVKEVGYANASSLDDIRSAVHEQTLAILYVKSHHCVQKNMVNVEDVIQLANSLEIPCIVDAAAEEDLSIYTKMGADFVCYSGAKAISGPTSGFVACKTSMLAQHMRLQYRGIGRVMKVGKEAIAGLVKAVELYTQNDGYISVITKENLEYFIERVNEIDGLHAILVKDEAGRAIYRARIQVKPTYGCTATQLSQWLKTYETPIYTRDYHANEGSLDIDPRPLSAVEDLNIIWEALCMRKGRL